MRIKFFCERSTEEGMEKLEDDVNEFMSGVRVVAVAFNVEHNERKSWINVLVMYEEEVGEG